MALSLGRCCFLQRKWLERAVCLGGKNAYSSRLSRVVNTKNVVLSRPFYNALPTCQLHPTLKDVAQSNSPQANAPFFHEDDRLSDGMKAALAARNVTQPTAIQQMVFPDISEGYSVLLASEPGSGKTLAYLIPLLERLHQQEIDTGIVSRLRRPRALVLLPTHELANQVLAVIKSLTHHVKLSSTGLLKSRKQRDIEASLRKPMDVIVATPERLWDEVEQKAVKLDDVQAVVIDEADMLLDDTFYDSLKKIVAALQARQASPENTIGDLQYIFSTATLGQQMVGRAKSISSNLAQHSTPGLHRALANVTHSFVEVSAGNDGRKEAVLALLQKRPGQAVMIFCNTVECCAWLGKVLAENEQEHIELSSFRDAKTRQQEYKRFAATPNQIAVCTDVASRGLDTVQVGHVINCNLPSSLATYIHRAGRTGRMGGVGEVTSLYTKRQKNWALAIKEAIESGRPIGTLVNEHKKRNTKSNKQDIHDAFNVQEQRPRGSTRSGPRKSHTRMKA